MANAFRSAWAPPNFSCHPSPMIRPSLTITAPTTGLGAVWPRPRNASSKALFIYLSSSISCLLFCPFEKNNVSLMEDRLWETPENLHIKQKSSESFPIQSLKDLSCAVISIRFPFSSISDSSGRSAFDNVKTRSALSKKLWKISYFQSIQIQLQYCISIFFHPDYTVGFGISPNPAPCARGLYRRSGISPCPEDSLFN